MYVYFTFTLDKNHCRTHKISDDSFLYEDIKKSSIFFMYY